jgi:hypothetical protein
MSKELRPGDRVRVTGANRMHSFSPGDKGTVLRGGMTGIDGRRYYVVSMRKAGATGTTVVFADEEIELDV